MKTELTITAAGKAALTAAGSAGPDAIEITGIAVGSAPSVFTDIAAATALQNEITVTDFRGDAGSTPGSIAGYGLFEGEDAWTAWEIGVYATVGNSGEILFAYALAVNNDSGVRVPLLTKTAGEPARYDFAFIFSPSSDVAPPPCSAPSSCSVPLTLSCFAPPYYYASPPPAPPSPPSPAPAQLIWRSVNKRPPHHDDVDIPVGHLWIHGKNEWTLESIIDGEAQWRQTKGIDLIYSVASRPSNQNRTQYEFSLSHDMSAYSFLSFHVRHTDSHLTHQDYNSPIQTSFLDFSGGGVINITDHEARTTNIQYVNDRTVSVQNEDVWYYIAKIYGIY